MLARHDITFTTSLFDSQDFANIFKYLDMIPDGVLVSASFLPLSNYKGRTLDGNVLGCQWCRGTPLPPVGSSTVKSLCLCCWGMCKDGLLPLLSSKVACDLTLLLDHWLLFHTEFVSSRLAPRCCDLYQSLTVFFFLVPWTRRCEKRCPVFRLLRLDFLLL